MMQYETTATRLRYTFFSFCRSVPVVVLKDMNEGTKCCLTHSACSRTQRSGGVPRTRGSQSQLADVGNIVGRTPGTGEHGVEERAVALDPPHVVEDDHLSTVVLQRNTYICRCSHIRRVQESLPISYVNSTKSAFQNMIDPNTAVHNIYILAIGSGFYLDCQNTASSTRALRNNNRVRLLFIAFEAPKVETIYTRSFHNLASSYDAGIKFSRIQLLQCCRASWWGGVHRLDIALPPTQLSSEI